MSVLDWAENEVKIACKKEAPNRKKGEWDYGCACYESALKAFRSLVEDGHSGFSFSITRDILVRLMNNCPLTPIEGTDDEWNVVGDSKYQSKRRHSLFKTVNEDGSVTYSDIENFVCEDINSGTKYYSGLVKDIDSNLFPITFPYNPSVKKTRYFCEEFLTDKKNGDFDTVGVFYAVKSDGGKIEINRYFDGSGIGWEEITEDEYNKRKERKIN